MGKPGKPGKPAAFVNPVLAALQEAGAQQGAATKKTAAARRTTFGVSKAVGARFRDCAAFEGKALQPFLEAIITTAVNQFEGRHRAKDPSFRYPPAGSGVTAASLDFLATDGGEDHGED